MTLPEFSSPREKEQFFKSLKEDQKREVLNEIIKASEHIVFLGGAGVSTESGIPDFRGAEGLYQPKNRLFGVYKPEYILSGDCLNRRPEMFFEYYRKVLDCRKAEPNEAHRKLAEMEQKGKLDGVITQNIDGLHQKAGSKKVCEIHGSIMRNYCVRCRSEYDQDFVFDSEEEVPVCPKCGKMVRPNVILYGELLDKRAHEQATALIRCADTLIIGGTSLEVGSATQLLQFFRGKYMVIINIGRIKLEGKADLVFHDSIGKVMSGIELA